MKAEKLMAAKLRGEAWPMTVRWKSKNGRYVITKCWTIKGHITTLYVPAYVKSYEVKWCSDRSEWDHAGIPGDFSWHPEDFAGNVIDRDERTLLRIRKRRSGRTHSIQRVTENKRK